MKLFGKLMPESVKDNAGNISSTRVQSYYVLGIIYVYSGFIMLCEILLMIKNNNTKISSEFMFAFGALLTHHLALLGINKNSKTEPTIEMKENKKETKKKSEEDLI